MCGSHELLLCPHVDKYIYIYIHTHTSRLQSCQTFGSPVIVTVAGGLLDKPVRCSGVADRSNSRFGHLTDEQPTPHFARSIRTSKVAPVKVGLQAPQVDTTFSLLDSTKCEERNGSKPPQLKLHAVGASYSKDDGQLPRRVAHDFGVYPS